MLGKILGFFTGGVTNPIEALGKTADSLFTSDEERLKAQKDIEELRQKPHLMQILTNITEAQHRSIFVAGWRPFLGWVGGWSLFTFYIPKHVMSAYLWTLQCFDIIEKAKSANTLNFVALPSYPIELDKTILELIIGMLGLALTRTVEKFGGKTK